MQTWTWALILILLASSFGLSAAQAWRQKAKQRSEDAWQRLVQHRFNSRDQGITAGIRDQGTPPARQRPS